MRWPVRSRFFGEGLMLVAGVASAAALGQTRQAPVHPGFEVASIRPHESSDNKAYVQDLQGRLVMQNFSLKQLILFAYDVSNNRLAGVQAWMDSTRYDIQATTETNAPVKQVEGPMLQALLEERFHLKVHRETMERPVYELTVGKGGLKMQRSKEGSCTAYFMDSPPPSTAPNAPRPVYCDFPHLAVEGTNWTLNGPGVSVGKLAIALARSGLDRPVVDRTGLGGGFDLHLTWAAEVPQGNPELGTMDDPAGLSIFAALKEQLGLKLEATKGPVEVLVIDHVEKPSEN